jgi:hypothetical protein
MAPSHMAISAAAPTANGLFAEAVALATAEIGSKAANTGDSEPGQICSPDGGQVMSTTVVVSKLAVASALNAQGPEAVAGSDQAQVAADPAEDVVGTSVATETAESYIAQSPVKSFIRPSPGILLTQATPVPPVVFVGGKSPAPAGQCNRQQVDAVVECAVADADAVAEVGCCEDGVRSIASTRKGEQKKGPRGSDDGRAQIGIQRTDGYAGAVVLVIQGTSAPTETGQTGGAGRSVPRSAESSDGPQRVSVDGRRTYDVPAWKAGSSLPVTGTSQPVAVTPPPMRSETDQSDPGAGAQEITSEQGKPPAGVPDESRRQLASSALPAGAVVKDRSAIVRAAIPDGLLPAGKGDSTAPQAQVGIPLASRSQMSQDDDPPRTRIHSMSYEPRVAKGPEDMGTTGAGRSVKSGAGVPSSANDLGETSATPAGGHVQSSDVRGGSALDGVATLDSGHRPHIAARPDNNMKPVSPRDTGATQDVGRQIIDSMQASLARGEREIVVRLHPPELGSVLVRFKEQDGQLHGLLEVSGSDTRREIEQALPQVLQALHDQGTHVRRLDVTVADQTQGDSGRGQAQQEAWSRQNWGQSREPFDASATYRARPDADGSAQETSDASPGTNPSRGGIDMWL